MARTCFLALSTFVPLTSLPGSKSKGPSQGGGVRGEAPQGKQALLVASEGLPMANVEHATEYTWLGWSTAGLRSAGEDGRTGILS